jgi:hypothetical protein
MPMRNLATILNSISIIVLALTIVIHVKGHR